MNVFTRLMSRLFGWDFVLVNHGYSDWKMYRIRVLWDGEIVYNSRYSGIKRVPPHDYISGIWLTCDPKKYIKEPYHG